MCLLLLAPEQKAHEIETGDFAEETCCFRFSGVLQVADLSLWLPHSTLVGGYCLGFFLLYHLISKQPISNFGFLTAKQRTRG